MHKNILITGSNSGIGRALIHNFSDEKNIKITAIDINFSDNFPSDVKRVILDLSDSITLEAWLKKHSNYDVVINCAGVREISSVADLTFLEWRHTMSINIDAAFLISKYTAKSAIAREKSCYIINIASISGLQAEPNRSAYIASKHALIGLTKAMAIELGSNNIRVNAIAPGIIETELTKSYFSDKHMLEKILKNTPLKRWGLVNNIVMGVNYLLQNDFVTGETMVIDGGWTIGKDL